MNPSTTRTCSGGLLVAALLTAPPLPAAPPSYAGDIEPIFLKHCHSCHSTSTPKGDLVLDRGTGFRALTERASIQVPGARLVAPGSLDASYLWAKLQGNVTVGKGMPRTLFSAKKLPPKDLEVIRSWIATGALP